MLDEELEGEERSEVARSVVCERRKCGYCQQSCLSETFRGNNDNITIQLGVILIV